MLLRRSRPALVVALLALIGACQAKIGDQCTLSTDCSIRGDRICDLSNRIGRKGECTIEGCGRGSCPKEATCVRTFGTDFLTVACEPSREDIATSCDSSNASCPADCVESVEGGPVLVCPPRDDCQANEICLPEGLCADQITSRTSCRRKCSGDKDCRTGYECKRTGSDGVYRVFDPDNPTDNSQIRICRPAP